MPDTHYAALLHADAQAHARRRQPLRLILIFLAVFFVLQYAWEMSRDSWLERTVIDHATVMPAAWLINALGTVAPVHADAYRIVSPLARLNIRNGCEGLETLFLLVAAFFSQPFPWKVRLWGIGLGTLLVYGLNQARIVILWHAWLDQRNLFGVLHGTVLPLVMIAVCLAYFLAFLARHESHPA